MKRGLITSVLTLMFAQNGVKDNTDLIRCNIFAMYLESLVFEKKPLVIDEIKQSSQYLGCHYDVPFTDKFLETLVLKTQELYDSRKVLFAKV